MPSVECGFDDPVNGSTLLNSYGACLGVHIGFDATYDPAKNTAPVLAIKNVEALIDTGADESCIDSLLAAQLKLPIVDQRALCGVTGIKPVNFYLAQVHVPKLKFTQYGLFAGVDLAASGTRFHALIGRSFLRYFKMTYDGVTGSVTMSW